MTTRAKTAPGATKKPIEPGQLLRIVLGERTCHACLNPKRSQLHREGGTMPRYTIPRTAHCDGGALTMADQMAYGGSDEDAPSIDDVKDLQARIGRRDYHIVWLGQYGFVIAHTDEERATIDLDTCELHQRLMNAEESPVDRVGYYMWLPAWDEFALLTVDGAS